MRAFRLFDNKAFCINALLAFALALAVMLPRAAAAQPDALSWPAVTREAKPWTRWWWFASAVNETELTQLLESYSAAGLGGVEITPIYGVRGKEKSFISFLSPEWMKMLAHTEAEAQRLGMGVDMDTGTGWPFGGPQVTPANVSKKVLLKKIDLKTGESAGADFFSQGTLAAASAVSRSGKTLAIKPADAKAWKAPEGEWILYAAFEAPTNQKVKRAAPGGEGFVMDHYDAPSVELYLDRFAKAFKSSGTKPPRAFFNDSYEVYGANWTSDFLKEFRARRGYDLSENLAAFNGDGDPETVSRVKCDYRETLSDLLLEKFTRTWTGWSHGMGAISRNQAHGSPGNLLDLYAAADIPETESFGASGFDIPGVRYEEDAIKKSGKPDPLMYKFASSAAHTSGKTLVSAESLTWLGEHFRVALSQMKPDLDQLFVMGVNHVVFQGTAYSPPDAKWPGWQFYAAVEFCPQNTWWRDFQGLTAYIARVQSFLQQGAPDGDALLYWPVRDAWSSPGGLEMQFSMHNSDKWLRSNGFGDAAEAMLARGYQFDYISDRLLDGVTVAPDGTLLAGKGAWRTLIVPKSRFMPPETMEKILALARAGATVVFVGKPPEDTPGLKDFEARGAKLRKLVQDAGLGGKAAASGDIKIGKGRIFIGGDIDVLLSRAGVRRERIVDMGAKFIREKLPDGYVYFISNFGREAIKERVRFSTPAKSAVIFDPLTGASGVADMRIAGARNSDIFVQLLPGQSIILRTYEKESVRGPVWPYYELFGTAYSISLHWKAEFIEGGPELPPPADIEQLSSWTEFGGKGAKYFSGTARYTKEFILPEIPAKEWLIDLGRVAESARVKLNGHDLGTMWAAPFITRIGDGFMKPAGEVNTLEVEVTNLMANRIVQLDKKMAPWKIMYEINMVDIGYKPFDASKWAPMESGLLGPVVLIPVFDPTVSEKK